MEIDADLKTVICSLMEHKNRAPRVIVYCRSLDICADLYAHFHYELGDNSYYPPGSHKISINRLFGMFHANTPQYNKEARSIVYWKPIDCKVRKEPSSTRDHEVAAVRQYLENETRLP